MLLPAAPFGVLANKKFFLAITKGLTERSASQVSIATSNIGMVGLEAVQHDFSTLKIP